MKAWIFRTLGNIAYRLNGGLVGDHNSRCFHFVIWAVAKQWETEEKAAGRIPK